jgi:hypothetical protein
MRTCLIILLIFIAVQSRAQFFMGGTVRNADDKGPVSFCSVAIKGTSVGALANEDGAFNIYVPVKEAILVFYTLGYERKEIRAADLQAVVYLSTLVKELKEVTIRGNDDRLYDLLLKCRQKARKGIPYGSKAYFQLSTRTHEQPVEMIEAYYNAKIEGTSINRLALKNGRVGLAEFDQRYFISFNTTRAIQYLSLTEESEYLPALPLQLGKAALKNRYELRQLDEDAQSYHIAFLPKRDKRKCFEGELWIDKSTFHVQKIKMECRDAAIHPFSALGEDTLKGVSLLITEAYEQHNGRNELTYMQFGYDALHKSTRKGDSIGHRFHDLPAKSMMTRGVIYFYDVGTPFELPRYKYQPYFTDYRKISLIPYNADFWEHANGLLHTKEQEEMVGFFERSGQLVNFTRFKLNDSVKTKTFFERNNYVWTDSTRINYSRNDIEPGMRGGNPFSNAPYTISAQIYLDVYQQENKWRHFSATVFDAMNTYLPEPIDAKARCFMNIYFDIYEIERRKMEQILSAGNYDSRGIDSVYRQTVKKAKAMIFEYQTQVAGGDNTEALKEWNRYSYERTGLDNMKIFGVE